MHKNSHAGCCYLCGNYVAIGAGELLKYRVAGHKYSLRCLPCGERAEKPSAVPTEANLNENAARIYRQALRKSLLELLCDPDLPAEKVRPGQAWLEQPGRTLEELHKLKDTLICLRNTRRQRRLNQEALAA